MTSGAGNETRTTAMIQESLIEARDKIFYWMQLLCRFFAANIYVFTPSDFSIILWKCVTFFFLLIEVLKLPILASFKDDFIDYEE